MSTLATATASSQQPRKSATSGRNSTTNTSIHDVLTSKHPSQQTAATTPEPNVHYTVFVRLPFPRGNFQEPPQVQWDSSKDKQLWKFISKVSSSKQLDWKQISERLDAPLDSVLQQAAWLYERHMVDMKAQMKLLGTGVGSNVPSSSTQQGEEVATGQRGANQDSGKHHKQLPSAILTQQSTTPAIELGDERDTPRALRPSVSRTPSTCTITQSRVFASSGRQPFRSPAYLGSVGQPAEPESSPGQGGALRCGNVVSSDLDEELFMTAQTQAGRRQEMVDRTHKNEVEDGDDDSSPDAYLPFAAKSDSKNVTPLQAKEHSTKGARNISVVNRGLSSEQYPHKNFSPSGSFVSASSTTSTNQSAKDNSDSNNRSDAPGRRNRAEPEELSPRYKNPGSDESRSMSSSFSDLDASVTQSALEDALMSNMKDGSIGMGSRLSTFREALGKK